VYEAEMCLFAVKLVPAKQQDLDEILCINYSNLRNMKGLTRSVTCVH
jgi:hypothetical protein